MIVQYALGFMAGGLSLLAPCVLPLLPLIVAGSLKTSKWGPLVGALGLTLSFTLFGILTTTFAAIFDPDSIRDFGAVVLILAGILFIVPAFKQVSSGAFLRLSRMGSSLQEKISNTGSKGEFLGGALLGIIWSPCTGPTLAFAVGLASQAKDLVHAGLIFFFFGLGAGLGLVTLGQMIRQFKSVRNGLLKIGKTINLFAGVLSFTIGALILTDLEGSVQDYILKLIPDWLTQLTVSI